MSKTRYQNEKMKRKYFDWVKGALGLSDKTIKVKEVALWKYDEFTKYQDYKKFNAATAQQFIKWIKKKKNLIRLSEFISSNKDFNLNNWLQDSNILDKKVKDFNELYLPRLSYSFFLEDKIKSTLENISKKKMV